MPLRCHIPSTALFKRCAGVRQVPDARNGRIPYRGRRAGWTARGEESRSMRRLLKLLRSEEGQGMSEYLIIVALVAIAAIGVVTVFGRDVRELFSGTTDSLAGNQASNTAVKANVRQNKSLKTFGTYNA